MKSERERFGSTMNFVSKTNIFKFFGDVSRKRKETILKKRWFDITNRDGGIRDGEIVEGEIEEGGCE